MTAARLLKVLEIVAAVDADATVCAEHDQLFVAPTEAPFTDEQRRELGRIGCVQGSDAWYVFT